MELLDVASALAGGWGVSAFWGVTICGQLLSNEVVVLTVSKGGLLLMGVYRLYRIKFTSCARNAN